MRIQSQSLYGIPFDRSSYGRGIPFNSEGLYDVFGDEPDGFNVVCILEHAYENYLNPKMILKGTEAKLLFNAESGYALPEEIDVYGCDAFWDRTQGLLSLRNVQCHVMIMIKSVDAGVQPGAYTDESCTELSVLPNGQPSTWENIQSAYSQAFVTPNEIVGGPVNSYFQTIHGVFVVDNSITRLGDNAFRSCSGIIKVILPEGLTSIGHHVFFKCNFLESVNIPSTVTTIGDDLVRDCIRLTNLTFDEGSSLTTIGDYTCVSCHALESVRIPDSVTQIGRDVIYDCPNIREFIIPTGLTKIREYMFRGAGITSINVPSNITEIERSGFFECRSLEEVTLPDTITRIGDYAFAYGALSTISIPSTVEYIGYSVFINDNMQISAISFRGTVNAWNAMSKDRNWKINSGITVVHCTDGDVNV